jgi:hypothetical protein
LPEPAVRAALAERALVLRVLLPPYPALGVGTLRVLRVREESAPGQTPQTEIIAGYDRYERLPE